MSNDNIEREVQRLIDLFNIVSAPVDVKAIAIRLGLGVTHYRGEGVSGVLVINKDKGTIGYNPLDPPVRQRFTIAHELGHYLLHKSNQQLFVDKAYAPEIQVEFRKENADYTNPQHEREANAFAASLLMPKSLLLPELHNHLDLAEDQVIKRLATKFQVSSIAMTIRISNLGFYLL